MNAPLPQYTDYFGGCPVCWKTDGYLNINQTHIFYCSIHKKAWDVGVNLFSSWRKENEEIWRRNHEFLNDFDQCEPALCLEPKIGGAINDVALGVPGVAERHATAVADYAIETCRHERMGPQNNDDILF